MLGWRVIGKQTRTQYDQREMLFVTFSDEWGRFEVTFFPDSFEKNAAELGKGYGPFLLKGKIEVEFGVPMLVADHVRLPAKTQPDVRKTYGPLRRPVRNRVQQGEPDGR